MTIPADDVALRDLCLDRVPLPITKSPRYIELLIAKVIEIEDNRIRFPAVDAWVAPQEVQQQSLILRYHLRSACGSAFKIRLAVLLVVPAAVFGLTLSTMRKSASSCLRAPREVGFTSSLAASDAQSGALRQEDERQLIHTLKGTEWVRRKGMNRAEHSVVA